jgi:hypothetical protein
VTAARRGTQRPFTVISCGLCHDHREVDVTGVLKESVRRCAHGILVSSACLRGSLSCAAHPHLPGTVVVLQPCGPDRRPDGPAHWIGPVRDQDDARLVCDWLERGEWDGDALPERLCGVRPETGAEIRRN